jgi:hypothetical protein
MVTTARAIRPFGQIDWSVATNVPTALTGFNSGLLEDNDLAPGLLQLEITESFIKEPGRRSAAELACQFKALAFSYR